MASGTPLGQMYIELGLDASKFSPSLNGAKNAVKYFQNNIRSLDSTLKGNGKNTDLLKAKYKTLGEAITAQKKVLDEMKKSFDKLEPGTAKWGKAAADIERENAKLSAMEAQLKKVGSALEEIGRKQTLLFKAGEGFKSFGKFAQSAGDKLHAMGNAFRPLSTLVAGGLTVATKKAIDFESQMNTTKSLLADTIPTADELNATTQKLGESSKGWAKQYGISTASINEGMQEIIKKGFDANQTIAAMPAILDASKASGDDFNVVMNASTNILRQFGLEAKDTNRVTDSLTYVANKTSAGFSDMGLAMEYVGPVAHSLGMSIEETSAAIGLLSDNGIAGEKAGTALRGALSKLLKPSKSNANAMRELGFSVEEFQSGALKLPEIIDRIKESTQDWTKEERASAIARAFGVEAQTGMNALINQGGDALRNLTKETENARGYTKKLADELSKSSKNGVERFKASLEVLGINIGQKLIPKLTPILDWANEMIDKFDKLDPVTQNWLTWLAVGVAGAYPALNLLGSGLKGIGTVSSGIGKTLQWINSFRKVGEVGNVAVATAGKTGLLETAITGLASPVGLLVGGTALLAAGLVYLGNEKDKARVKAEEFGTQLSDTARSELRQFQSVVDDTTNTVANFGTHAGDVDKVAGAFKNLYQVVADTAAKSNQRVQELASKWGLTPEQVAKAQEHNNQIVKNTETMMNQINDIYQRHNGDASKFSQEEKEIVLNNQREMISAKLELMGLSAKEQKAVLQALNGEIKGLNETQLKHTKASLEQAMKEESELYKQSKTELKELLNSKAITRQEYNAKVQQLENEHNQTMEGLGTRYFQVMNNLDAKLKQRTGQSWNYWEKAKKTLEEYGLSYDVIGEKAAEAAKSAGNSHSILAKYSSEMSAETKEANDAWSLLIGNINENNQFEIKSNVKEVIGEATRSAEGWEQFKFIAKNADINTNARVTMAEALSESGKWNEMTVEEKQLVVNNQDGLRAIVDSKEHLEIWNSMPEQVKQLLLDNEDVMSKAEVAKATLDNYNNLTPNQKKLLADDENVRNAVSRSTEILKNWDAATPFPKDLKVNADGVLNNTQLGIDKLIEWNSAAAPIKEIKADASSAVNESGKAKGAVEEFNNTQALMKVLDANANPLFSNTSQAMATLGQFNATLTPTKQLNAQDNASLVAQGVLGWVNSIPEYKLITIEAKRNGEAGYYASGTSFHPGGLAVVNDQKGPVYRELVQFPTGERFIPEGRDVVLPLPRGAKVFPAYKTKRLMRNMGISKYADGVGIPSDAKFIREMEQAQQSIVVQNSTTQTVVNMDKVVSEVAILRSSLENLLTMILRKDNSVYLNGAKITDHVTREQREREMVSLMMNGVRV